MHHRFLRAQEIAAEDRAVTFDRLVARLGGKVRFVRQIPRAPVVPHQLQNQLLAQYTPPVDAAIGEALKADVAKRKAEAAFPGTKTVRHGAC